jgi:hypothetical protein
VRGRVEAQGGGGERRNGGEEGDGLRGPRRSETGSIAASVLDQLCCLFVSLWNAVALHYSSSPPPRSSPFQDDEYRRGGLRIKT